MLQFFYALIALLSWGTEGIFDKKSLEKLNPFNALSVRYFFVFLMVVSAAFAFTEIKLIPLGMIPYFLFTCLTGSATIIFFFKAIKESGISLPIAIGKNYFLVTAAISMVFFGETLSLIQGIAMLFIIMSIIVLSFDSKEKMSLSKGTVYSLLTLIGWGAYFALIKPVVLELNPFNASMFLESTIFFMILIYSLATKKELKLKENKANAFALIASVLLVIGSISYNYSITLVGASLTAVAVAPTPIITSVMARIFLKEKLPLKKYLAVIVSVAGIALLFL